MRGAVEQGAAALSQAGVASARYDAERLLAHLLGTDRGGLLVRADEPIDDELQSRYRTAVERRARREPLQHVIGEQEFYGLAFEVDRHVLIPRPETELLVDTALGLDLPPAARVVDLGTGSGCIAVALAVARPGWRIEALDLSAEALVVAGRNAARHGVAGRVGFHRGDLAAPPGDWIGTMDLVLSNPPYVSEAEWAGLEPEVRDHDPRPALVAGPGGYEVYDVVLPVAVSLLVPGGTLLLELGHGQARGVCRRARAAGLGAPGLLPDLQGIDRVLVARRNTEGAG